MIEFFEMRGPNKIFGPFCEINGQNILFGPLISENSIVKPPLNSREAMVHIAFAYENFEITTLFTIQVSYFVGLFFVC